jgi:Zn-finger nucleic acid-binding protein
MSELSTHPCPRCNVGLYIEVNDEVDGVDLLICKQCWGVGVAAKSIELVISKGSMLDENRGDNRGEGDCNCPMCDTLMDEIELDIPENIIEKISMIGSQVITPEKVIIDSCRNCPTFWFDAGELDLLNGIKPKFRTNDPEKVRLLEDQTLTSDDLKKRGNMRRILGGFGLLGAFAIGSGGELLIQFVAAIIGVGAIIAIFTKNPEIALATGTCDKCLESDKLLAWNCQTGGCWAHICSDCQSVGEDPVEVYARTLGKVAVGTVIVGVGLGVVIATKGSTGGGMMELAGGIVLGDEEENSMLLCKECKDRLATKKSKNDKSENTRKKVDFENTNEKDFLLENFTLNDGYCNHVDSITDKKCKRISFRKGSYCYVHKDSY